MCDLAPLLDDRPDLVGAIAVLSCRCRQGREVGAAALGGAIVLQPARTDRIAKMLWLLGLRWAMRRAARTLRGRGFTEVGAFAAWPSLERSAIVYEIGTAAARYAEERTIPGEPSALAPYLRLLSGVVPSVDVVVVLGLTPVPTSVGAATA